MTQVYKAVEDENYFRSVLRNMLRTANPKNSHLNSTVQFGETGKGITPHYMIVDATSEKHVFDGRNHKAFKTIPTEQFSDDNLSPSLTFEQVQEEIGKRRSSK